MLLEIKVWNKTTMSLDYVYLNPDTFYKCIGKNDGLTTSYFLTTTLGDEFELFESEMKRLEKEGYIRTSFVKKSTTNKTA